MPRTAIFLYGVVIQTFLAPLSVSSATSSEAEIATAGVQQDPLLAGVTEIAAPGVPGTLAVWGDTAKVLVAGSADRDALAAVVASGGYGAGRLVAFGHTGYTGKEALAVGSTRELMVNCIRWASRGEAPRVLTNSAELAEVLSQAAVPATHASDWHTKLADGSDGAPTVVVISGSFDDDRVPALAKYVSRGGGLILCQTGWGWLQGAKGNPMMAFSANKVLAPAGIAFTDQTAARTSERGFDVEGRPPTEMCHALSALDALSRGSVKAGELAQAEYSAVQAARMVPREDHQLRPRLEELLALRRAELIPTEAHPISAKDPLPRVLLAHELENAMWLPADFVRAHPAAADFPGAVAAGVRPGGQMFDSKITEAGWYSTGMYAPPGVVVTLAVGGSFVKAGLGAQIGSHSDKLWHKDEWKRVPEIVHAEPFETDTVRIASPFGGLVYFTFTRPADLKRELPLLRASVRGVVPAPQFILGKTQTDAWVKSIRQLPAPWAELGTSKVIVTVPSESIRALEKPEEVLNVWDEIMDAQADLAAIPRERKRPERIVADRQISAGYMHAGYPIMTHLDAAPAMVSAEKLKEGQWGLFHELGHNHQNPDWTFDGTGEVTCNLFSLYTMEKVCGKAFGEGHDALKDWKQKAAAYMKSGAKFDVWKKDPFLALTMYMQLAEAFGWDTYKKVFAEYNGLKKDERPKTDDEKRDQWMVRFSKACGKNLGPFFEAWGVPTSSAARDSIKDLGAWMPPG